MHLKLVTIIFVLAVCSANPITGNPKMSKPSEDHGPQRAPVTGKTATAPKTAVEDDLKPDASVWYSYYRSYPTYYTYHPRVYYPAAATYYTYY